MVGKLIINGWLHPLRVTYFGKERLSLAKTYVLGLTDSKSELIFDTSYGFMQHDSVDLLTSCWDSHKNEKWDKIQKEASVIFYGGLIRKKNSDLCEIIIGSGIDTIGFRNSIQRYFLNRHGIFVIVRDVNKREWGISCMSNLKLDYINNPDAFIQKVLKDNHFI